MGDRSKLPKWAQKEIETLEMRVREAERRAEQNLELAGLQQGRYGDLIVPDKTRIYFGDDDTEGISVRYEKGALEVRAGWRGLSVRPQASNVVRVTQESW